LVRLTVLNGLLIAVGVLAGLAATPVSGSGLDPIPLVALCAVLFAVAEYAKVHVEVRDQALSVSLSDLPLVIGLFTVPFWWLLTARLLTTAVAMAQRRHPLQKSVFNLCLFTAEVGVAYLLAGWLIHPVASIVSAWPAALVTVLAVGAVGVVAVLTVIVVLQGWPSSHEVLLMVASVSLSGMVAGSVAVLSLLALQSGVAGYSLLAVAAGVAVIAFRSYSRLLQEHADLGEILDAARLMSGSATTADLIISLTEEAARLVKAEQAQVWLPGVPSLEQTLPPSGSAPVVIRETTRVAGEREWLVRTGFRDALVMPIEVDGKQEGVLVVHDRLGSINTFNTNDLHLLQTLVTHATAVWNNMNLVGRLRHEATHDPLTDLPNRSAFTAAVERMLGELRAGRAGRLAVVLLMDIDRFKEINDILGHPAGDRLLVMVARRLATVAPREGVLARLGGDEFALLLPQINSPKEAEALATRLTESLAQPFSLSGSVIDVSASVGIAGVFGESISTETLLRHVDIAMHTAKTRQSNFAWYSPENDRGTVERLNLVGQLRRAIDENQISVDFQPQIRLSDRRVVGFEALARWTHPERGPIAPDEFIPLADQTGQVGTLTLLALRKSLEQCSDWDPSIGVSVNLPARLLLDPDLPAELAEVTYEFGIDPSRVTIELTEDSLVSYDRDSMQPLHRLRGIGFRLSIDDFGTGYSSLAYLRQLPVQEIKIDKSFMVGVADTPGAAALVRSIIEVSHVLGMTVVAEGVEDSETLEIVDRLGCDVGQGYLLGRPMAPDLVVDWLARHR
jgi:diguanylate cyclase (GGDEF)-like protein